MLIAGIENIVIGWQLCQPAAAATDAMRGFDVMRACAILAAIVGLACAVMPARAQPYPNHPIKLIVPFPPGGPVDVMARLVAQRLSQTLGPVIIDNRPGAGGTIGSKSAASAEPDGYTLLFGSSTTLAAGPALYKNLGYDPIRSFAPVAMISSVPFALVVAPSVPARSVAELVAYAKARPGKLNFGAPTGTLPHLTAEMFKAAAAIDIVHIPYRGAANAITDMLIGQIDMAFEPTSVLLGHISDGKLRPLAVTSATRSAELADVPTMIESGFPGFVSLSWSGIVAPAGTPAEIVDLLNTAVNASIDAADTRANLAKMGAEPRVGTTAEFAALIAAETPKWAAVVKAAGIKVD
jgi:tripartite-type tricarboxylate transporter receptor subunit TctC